MVADESEAHEGFFVSSKRIYDEIVAVRVLVSPLPARIEDHEARIREIEAGKLAVSDYRMERAENDTKFQMFDKRATALEGASLRFSGAKTLVAWLGCTFGAVVAAHFIH